MTLNTGYKPNVFQGNGVIREFAYDFNPISIQYLKVYFEEDDKWVEQTSGWIATSNSLSNYDLENMNIDTLPESERFSVYGGLVTFDEPPTTRVQIARVITEEQSTSFKTSSGFDAKVVETSLDKLTGMIQQLQEASDRSVKVIVGDNQTPEELLDEVYERLDSSIEIAENAIVAAGQAQTAADNATAAVESAEQTLVETQAYVDTARQDITNTKNSAVSEINAKVISAKAEIDSTVDEATMDVSDIVSQGQETINQIISDAEVSIGELAVSSVEAQIPSAIQSVTQASTDNVAEYVSTSIRPVLESYTTAANNAKDTAIAQANLATTKAGEASTYTEEALSYKNSAHQSELNAATSEANALASANNASTSETNAMNHADDAMDYMSQAESFASASESAKDLSVEAKNEATSQAVIATNAKDTATSQANIATTKAGEAETYASNASQSATNARNSETNASTYASNALVSANNAHTSELNAQAALERLGTVIKIKGRVNTFDDLPTSGNLDGDTYLVGADGLDSYPEYYWYSNHWEFLGTSATSLEWGAITGTLSSQTDLQNALDSKQPTGNYALKSELFSKDYNDLTNKPSIPSKVSELTNDSGYTTNTGTITGITMNGTSKGTSGVVDLGTVITSHQDISGKLDKSGGTMTGELSMGGNHLKNINYAYANWYNISGSIASTSPATEVLIKQGGWIYSRTPAQLLSDIGGQATISDLATIRDGASKGATALQSYTETDPTVPSYVKSITQTNITTWNNKQNQLVSGTNIKTVNNTSLLGSGNIEIKSAPDLDNVSISKNSSDALQTIAVIDNNNSNAIKTWTGTKVQYDAITTKDSNTLYHITDDTDTGTDLLQMIYPVGSLYLTTNATCPLANLFGTWTLVSQDRVLQGAGSRGSVGTTLQESLPNIKGGVGVYNSGNTYGATTWNNTSVSGTSIIGSGTANGYVDFDASRSSSTYQDNAPVQQNAYLINVYRRIA